MREMTMPSLGESVMECTVLSILKKVGDRVEVDDSVLEVATDKVDTEIPCPYAGTITEVLVNVGDVVPVGSVVMRFDGEVSDNVIVESKEEVAAIEQFEASQEPIMAFAETISNPIVGSKLDKFLSPLVLTIARMEGISELELKKIVGTGAEGRVTKTDILQYLEKRKLRPHQGNILHATGKTDTNLLKSDMQLGQIVPLDRMRRMISERMVESRRISAHVTSYVECDVTDMVRWREQNKEAFMQKYGISLTFTPLFVEAIARAILDFPQINASIEGDDWVIKPNVNIGMAVAMPNGNLIVPVLHNADKMSLVELAERVNDLTMRGRKGQLKPDDLAGGTYTFSNIGTFDNIMGTPIILQPQLAIMALGAIKKRPVVIGTPQGDTIGIRSMMYLSHSYDHRVVDGLLGGMFVKRVSDYLSNFDVNRLF